MVAMKLPTLSVIIPNFNHAHCIGRALDALLTQSVRPAEIIVIDDASTDDSVAVVEAFAKRDPAVRLLRNDRNMGTHAAANKGIVNASGEFVHVTASDDRVMPGFVEKSLNMLARHPHAGLCWSDNMTYDVEKKVFNPNRLRLSYNPCYFSPAEIARGLRKNYIPCLSGHSSVIKRSALMEAGMLIPQLHWHACYIPEVLMCIEMSSSSYMRRGVRQRRERRRVLKYMLDLGKSSEYADVYPAIRASAFLGWFDFPILAAVLLNPRHWDYLNAAFLRKVLWNGMKKNIANFSPYFAQAAYHSMRDCYRGHIRKGLKKSYSRNIRNSLAQVEKTI